MTNYQEIITTKVLIDEYNIESETPLVQNAMRCDLVYKEISNEKRDYVEFIIERIIISDIVSIEDWEKYYNDFNKFLEKENSDISDIQDITQTFLADDKKSNLFISSGPTDYKDPYNIAGAVGTCVIGRNSKYSKYLRKIGINKFKVNDYSYFLSIDFYLNDYTKSVFNKILNNNSMYINDFGCIDNDDLFYCYADIIKYELINNLKNDGLIINTGVDNPVYSLYLCSIDLKKNNNFDFLGLNGNLNKIKTKEILTNNIEMSSLFYLNFDKTQRDYSRENKVHFLSILLGYHNLHNILLSINYEQLKIIDDDLHHNKINYKKIESINKKYFILSGLINNYETSIFSGYNGLKFYDGAKYIKSETYVKIAYDSIKKVKNELDYLYQDVSKLYDINRIRADSKNSKMMLIVSIITLIVSFIALIVTKCQIELPKNNYIIY